MNCTMEHDFRMPAAAAGRTAIWRKATARRCHYQYLYHSIVLLQKLHVPSRHTRRQLPTPTTSRNEAVRGWISLISTERRLMWTRPMGWPLNSGQRQPSWNALRAVPSRPPIRLHYRSLISGDSIDGSRDKK